MVSTRSGRCTDGPVKSKSADQRKKEKRQADLRKQQYQHAQMQNADAESRRIKMWIDENPGKTENDYKKMKQAKFQAGLKAMKANTR
jgi:hypothetical protein